MAKVRTSYRCTECGAVAPKWVGRCAACAEWNTLEEEVATPAGAGGGWSLPREAPRPIVEVDMAASATVPTGIAELDRVLSGGLVPGSVTLLGGEPGIGKSTLLTQLAGAGAKAGRRVLYVSAEESAQQVRIRAQRLGAIVDGLWLVSEVTLPGVLAAIEEVQPDLVIVDSIQTVADPELGSAPGSMVQVRECAHRLVREAKARTLSVLLVGHVTKEGGLAGPRVLEHVVDTVLTFEGDRHHGLRLLRAVKHRFGSTNELGLFELGEAGLVSLADPSDLFLADRRPGIAGSAVVPTLEGHRPLLVELQALVARSHLAMPRRSAQGVDSGRLALLLAVLEARAGVVLSAHDVFALAVGGVKVVEPGADLPLALALVSAAVGTPLPEDLVACGEIGLGGEVRQVAQAPRRLAEAARLGFRRAVVPASSPAGPAGLELHRVSTVADAVDLLFGGDRRPTPDAGGRSAAASGPRGERRQRSTGERSARRAPARFDDEGDPW